MPCPLPHRPWCQRSTLKSTLKSTLRSTLRSTLLLALLPLLWFSPACAQRLAYDECDGRHSAGFRGDRYGAWQGRVLQGDGFITAIGGNDYRTLEHPVTGGVVFYAVTLRMQQPISGYASVVPAADLHTQFCELGANSGYQTQHLLWTTAKGVVTKNIDGTKKQTLLQRFDLDRGTWSAWCALGDGQSLLDANGRVTLPPRVADCKLPAQCIEALYLSKGSAQTLEIHRVSLARTAEEALLPVTSPSATAAAPSTQAPTAKTSNTAALITQRLAPVEVPLIPWPRSLERNHGALTLPATFKIATDSATLDAHAAVFAAELQALTGSKGHVAHEPDTDAIIRLRLDKTLANEAHTITITDAVTVCGSDAVAIAHGTASLLHLLDTKENGWQWECLRITDSPTCSYRGLLVDVARKPHPIATLTQLVTLCRLYKVRYLQLHLTDDQAFTFPSTAFPKLATKGHSYTQAELSYLEAFATARGVSIVPEFDVPGHCGALIKAMPELFRAHDLHHATIAFVKPEVLLAVDTILGEMLAIFPSAPFCHIGGDEADLEHVLENPIFAAALKDTGLDSAEELYRHFLCQLRERILARGKQMIVWEGFAATGKVTIPRDVIVMAFESLYHTPDKLVENGYPVINASWQPLYVVNDRCWSEREIYAWNRGHFQHFIEGYPAFRGIDVPVNQVLGAQLCAFEQPAELELQSLRKRLAAMAERTWNEGAGRSFEDFAARLQHSDRRLDQLLGNVR